MDSACMFCGAPTGEAAVPWVICCPCLPAYRPELYGNGVPLRDRMVAAARVYVEADDRRRQSPPPPRDPELAPCDICGYRDRWQGTLAATHTRLQEEQALRLAAEAERKRLEERLGVSPFGDDQIDALQQALDMTRAEAAQLRSEVREWICEKCQTVFPGPPQAGIACVVCPHCDGYTSPRAQYDLRQARSEIASLKAAMASMASPLTIRCADALADEVAALVRRHVVDSRDPVADALLDYRNPPSSPRADRLAEMDRQAAQAAEADQRLAEAIASLQRTMCADPRDWSLGKRDAWIYGVIVGWPGSAMVEVAAKHQWASDDVDRLIHMHAEVDRRIEASHG